MKLMTIGIAVCLSDGALLIADGLVVVPPTKNYSRARAVSTDLRKITRIGSTLAAIKIGIEIGTEHALSMINRSALDIATSVEDIVTEIERCSLAGWEHLLSKLGSDDDPTNEHLRVIFLVGGYIRASPMGGLILATLYRPEGHCAPLVKTTRNKLIVIGGEDQDAQELFRNYAQREYDQLSRAQLASNGSGIRNYFVNAMISAGVRTINEVSVSDPLIGGTIRYTIIRRGFPITEGTCT